MQITTIGIDWAKNVFQIHGVDGRGKTVLKKQLRRDRKAVFFANLARCLISMEACGSAHYWARKLQAQGHTVRLIAPQFVKPYVKTNKHDAADAEAICEAVTRPNMRFVPIKNVEQQAALALHRVRQGWGKARTAQANPHIPSGTVAARHKQSPNVRGQPLPSCHHELKAWQTGGVHVRIPPNVRAAQHDAAWMAEQKLTA